ncbi:3',5'-nucleoside bisphosphate phosphatase [Imbroritus primus]|uniref:3',5'-nucleoside bisphosphate phosphatase n=1 Tax=Imbroritus primus TaxID=3058603 RepID=UPI003D1604FA
MLNADLHCHSTVSDGMLPPEALAARAKTNGVELWALTDHDEVGGLVAARHAAHAEGLSFVPGVEISITWAGHTVHIVGLQIDPFCPALVEGLAQTRSGRTRRAQEMADALAQAGVAGAYEGALQYVGNPELISRTHFARYMVEAGICPSVNAVFESYLSDGKPGYVPHRWATLEDAIEWIHAAGGQAVIAHPGRYKMTALQHDSLFDRFKELGGEGVEVTTGSHTPAQYETYAGLARRYGLLASRGSDFHGPSESRVDLGKLPPLPDSVTPIWRGW